MWYQVFLSNIINLLTFILYQVFLSNMNNLHSYDINYSYLIWSFMVSNWPITNYLYGFK